MSGESEAVRRQLASLAHDDSASGFPSAGSASRVGRPGPLKMRELHGRQGAGFFVRTFSIDSFPYCPKTQMDCSALGSNVRVRREFSSDQESFLVLLPPGHP